MSGAGEGQGAGVAQAERVRAVARAAKLHEGELTATAQVLCGAGAGTGRDLRLLLLPAGVLQHIEAGDVLVFKGEGDENVVLCTDSKTYDVKETETSNSLLLVPDLLFAAETSDAHNSKNNSMEVESDTSLDKSSNSFNQSTESEDLNRPPRRIEEKDIVKTFFTYYELRPCKPRVGKLVKLLKPTRYRGIEHEYAVDKTLLYDYDRLFDRIQASRKELDDALNTIQAVKIDKFYRLMDFDYEFRVLSYMLDLIDENSWSLDRISKEITMESLKELVPLEVLEGMFVFYTKESMIEDEVQYYEYRQDKVCKFLARVLLKSAGKFNLAEFMQAWSDSVPEGMVADESMLSGIALVDKAATPQVIWGFSESDLPDDISERFRILFQTRAKWTVDEISPYIECYATDKMNVNALLTKHARASTQGGLRVFSAKHNK